MWKYDGTNATRVADINPGSTSSSPANLTVFNGFLFFAATDPTAGRELWKYDGTNVSRFAEINPGSSGSSFGASEIFNGSYYFAATGTNTALYKYDGTNFTVVSTTRYPESGGDMVLYKGALHFSNSGGSIVDQIWKYDGTNFTSLGGVFPGYFGEIKEYNGILYFPGEESSHGRELWKCDGTNTTFALDIYPGANGSSPIGLTLFQGKLYFLASDAAGLALWKFDGTNATRINGITPYSFGGLLEFRGQLCLSATTNGSDYEPWKYDGTNFTKIAEINVFNTNSSALFWTLHKNLACFTASDGVHGAQLWTYDGTNVTRITDLATLAGYYAFSFFDTLYFLGNDGLTGYELWKYDGTSVSQVADINPGFSDSLPIPHRIYNNALFFEANDGLHGTELWRLDPVSQLVRFTQIKRQGSDIALTWTTPGNMTNVLQSTRGVVTNFSDRSGPLVSVPGDMVTLQYLDVGGATNPSAFYRIRIP